jgi:hypothetical protein
MVTWLSWLKTHHSPWLAWAAQLVAELAWVAGQAEQLHPELVGLMALAAEAVVGLLHPQR